jgi:hypothetical protein
VVLRAYARHFPRLVPGVGRRLQRLTIGHLEPRLPALTTARIGATS